MSPRIAYWTSSFEFEMEGIASEVALLRRHFPRSVAWGLSHRHRLLVSQRRGYCLHPRLHLVFRAATLLLEPLFQLNHIFGALGDWFYLAGARRRPTVLTMAAFTQPVKRVLLNRVDRFVAEYPGGQAYLKGLGIAEDRIRLIFPPVDLQTYIPANEPEGPFTVLFASSPEREDWLASRGIPELLDAAALRPQMRFRFLWRPWGNGLPRMRRWVLERGLTNVEIVVGRCLNMTQEYQRAHATVAAFRNIQHCKPMPNSLLESLACGRPLVVTSEVGLADLVHEEQAGVVCTASGQGLAEGFDQLRLNWRMLSRNARSTAENWFSAERFVESYRRLYQELL